MRACKLGEIVAGGRDVHSAPVAAQPLRAAIARWPMSVRYCMPSKWMPRDRAVRSALRLPHGLAERSDAEHAAAARDHVLAGDRRSRHGTPCSPRVATSSPVDGVAFARPVRIARRGEHHAERGATIPVGVDLIERAVDRVLKQLDQIRLQPHHDRLRLRIAEAAVEFERSRIAFGVDHHAGVQEPGVRHAVRGHAVDRRHG